MAPPAARAAEESGSTGILSDALMSKRQFFGEPDGGGAPAFSDDARVRAAVATAQAVHDGEEAVRILVALPESLRGRAVASLDAQGFKNLIGRLPANRREALGPLMLATQDPERRLLLWREVHLARAVRDTGETIAATDADATLSAAQKQRRDKATNAILAGTRAEVDQEVAHLEAAWRKPGARAQHADVTAMAERKELEHDIERTYNVNITNDDDANLGSRDRQKMPTKWSPWSADELRDLQAALARIPAEHILGDRLLPPETRANGTKDPRGAGLEIHRSSVAREFEVDFWREQPGIVGDHKNGVIRFFDSGIAAPIRRTGETDWLGGHEAGGARGRGPISAAEEALVHEIGHDVDEANGALGTAGVSMPGSLTERFRAAAAWAAESDAEVYQDLVAKPPAGAGLGAAKANEVLLKMDGKRDTLEGYETTAATTGDRVYRSDPYQETGYVSHARGAVPEKDEDPKRHWVYARSHPAESFAEQYAMAAHVPTSYHEDMIARPQRDLDAARAQVDAAKAALAAGASDAERAAAQKRVDGATRLAASLETRQKARAAQFGIMRNEVFHADAAETKAEAALAARRVPASRKKAWQERIQKFKADAAVAVTPAQIERLKDQALADLANL